MRHRREHDVVLKQSSGAWANHKAGLTTSRAEWNRWARVRHGISQETWDFPRDIKNDGKKRRGVSIFDEKRLMIEWDSTSIEHEKEKLVVSFSESRSILVLPLPASW